MISDRGWTVRVKTAALDVLKRSENKAAIFGTTSIPPVPVDIKTMIRTFL